jgi:hypothetical protein
MASCEQQPAFGETHLAALPDAAFTERQPDPAIAAQRLPTAPELVQRSIGESVVGALSRRQERDRRAGSAAGRLLSRIEAATERQQQRMETELEAGDNALLKHQYAYDKRMYEWASRRTEKFASREASFQARSTSYHKQGGIFGALLGWINGTIAGYYRLRTRFSQRRQEYHLEGLC